MASIDLLALLLEHAFILRLTLGLNLFQGALALQGRCLQVTCSQANALLLLHILKLKKVLIQSGRHRVFVLRSSRQLLKRGMLLLKVHLGLLPAPLAVCQLLRSIIYLDK